MVMMLCAPVLVVAQVVQVVRLVLLQEVEAVVAQDELTMSREIQIADRHQQPVTVLLLITHMQRIVQPQMLLTYLQVRAVAVAAVAAVVMVPEQPVAREAREEERLI